MKAQINVRLYIKIVKAPIYLKAFQNQIDEAFSFQNSRKTEIDQKPNLKEPVKSDKIQG